MSTAATLRTTNRPGPSTGPSTATATANRRYVVARGTLRTAAARVETLHGAEHVVVPVVALLGNAVIRPLGSAGPELVPEHELAAFPHLWNNRPVTLDHPEGGRVSANSPAILERYAMGTVFNAGYAAGELRMEAWINPNRAETLGDEAVRVLEAVAAGEEVEVSVGCYVTVEPRAGSYNGRDYTGVWSGISPDHLALLPAGATGACSVAMGCGTNRAARRALAVQAASINGRTLRAARLSDVSLRDRLWQLLYAVEPGFADIVEVYPADREVFYAVTPTGRAQLFYRTYSIDAQDRVSLNNDRQEVEMTNAYRNVNTAGAHPQQHAAGCQCQQHRARVNADGTVTVSRAEYEETLRNARAYHEEQARIGNYGERAQQVGLARAASEDNRLQDAYERRLAAASGGSSFVASLGIVRQLAAAGARMEVIDQDSTVPSLAARAMSSAHVRKAFSYDDLAQLAEHSPRTLEALAREGDDYDRQRRDFEARGLRVSAITPNTYVIGAASAALRRIRTARRR